MVHKTLKELKDASKTRPTPYSSSITVKVVKVGHIAKFTDANGQPGELLNFSIADNTGAMLASLSDKGKQNRIVEGETLHVRDFVVKNDKVAMSHKTTIMGRPKLDIPSAITETAIKLIMPYSPVKKLSDARTSPLRSIFTIRGQVVKNEATKTVKVSGNDTVIRTITLEEDGNSMDVTLWRDLATTEHKIGEFLQLSHCLLNEWQGNRSLNSTRNTVVEKIQPLEVVLCGDVEALSLTETCFEVAIKQQGKEGYRDLKIDIDMIRKAISKNCEEVCLLNPSEIEDMLLEHIPFQVKVQGCQVLQFQCTLNNNQEVDSPDDIMDISV